MKKANNKPAGAAHKEKKVAGKIPPEAGGPEKDVETKGIKMRGYGAATKGFMVRGPV